MKGRAVVVIPLFLVYQLSVTVLGTIVNEHLGMDEPGCIEGHSEPCQSLKYAVDNNSTDIILTSNITVREGIVLKNRNMVSIIGNETSIIECTCSSMNECGGLLFTDIVGIWLSNIHIYRCSMQVTVHKNSRLSMGIGLIQCQNITLSNVVVSDSNGFGISLINSGGYINIVNSKFMNNSCRGCCKDVHGGGGMLIYHTEHNTTIITTNCGEKLTTIGHKPSFTKGNYSIINCDFKLNNQSVVMKNKFLSHGGGLNFILNKAKPENYFRIYNSTFVNNKAAAAGGVAIILENSKSLNNIMIIERCNLTGNHGGIGRHHWGGGGAMKLSIWSTHNKLTITDTQFVENTARYGGGVSVVCGRSSIPNNTVYFTECIWQKNTASVSGAIDLSPDIYNQDRYDFNTHVKFKDCTIIDNYLEPFRKDITFEQGKGIFLIMRLKVTFQGKMYFENNSQTALFIDSSYITIKSLSTISFTNNKGNRGGGIRMLGTSCLHYENNVTFIFENNTSIFQGGAIYSEDYNQHLRFSSNTCIFKPEAKVPMNIQFHFRDNFAHNFVGMSIYMTTIQPCIKACEKSSTSKETQVKDPFKETCLGNFTFENHTSSITTDIKAFSSKNSSFLPYINGSCPLKVIPGFSTHIPLKTIDDYNTETTKTSALYVDLENEDNGVNIDAGSPTMSNSYITINGDPGKRGILSVYSNNIAGKFTHVHFILMQCPPGFIMADSKCICSNANRYLGIIECTHDSGFLTNGYWAGYKGHGSNETPATLLTANCPTGYCKPFNGKNKFGKIFKRLPKSASREELERTVCATNRHGMLCGRCKENTSVYYHSWNGFECRENKLCEYGPVFFILVDIVPITVLFILLLLFDVSLTNGMAYSVIFMSQQISVLNLTGNIQWDKHQHAFVTAIKAIYSMSNLEFLDFDLLSFCLWKRAQAMDVLLVNYASVIFSILLVCTFVLLMKCCNCKFIKRICKRKGQHYTVVKGLTAFLILCYTRTARTTFYILNKTKVYGEGMKTSLNVPQLDGEFRYLHGNHLIYAIPAIVFLVFVVIPPPLILICDPLFLMIEDKLGCHGNRQLWTRIRSKFKPVLDAFQHCFRSGKQFYAGIFFLYRVTTLGSLSLSDTNPEYHYLLEFFLIAFITFHSIVQPFEKASHNSMAALCFFNLAIINMCTIIINNGYVFHKITIFKWLQISFLFLPIIIGVIWIMKYAGKKCLLRFNKDGNQEESDSIDIFNRNITNYGLPSRKRQRRRV